MSASDTSPKKNDKETLMPIPAGTPYSILAQAANKFDLELIEKDIVFPGSAQDEIVPKGWFLQGKQKDLEAARAFIIQKMKEHMKRFE